MNNHNSKITSLMTNTIAKKMIAIISILCIVLCVSPIASAQTFSDVPSNHWAYTAIDYVSTNGYMIGTGGNNFSPNMVVTKAQIVTTLFRVAETPGTPNTQPYSDVPTNKYYYTPVCWAYHKSLSQILQTSSTLFSPNNTVTRVKIAVFLWKFAQVCNWATNEIPSISLPFNDISSLSSEQKNAIKWCFANEIMIGVSETSFSPYTTVTRAQLAVIINNLDEYISYGKAFCVGTNYNDSNGIDTSIDATNARNSYEALGYNVNCVTVPTVTNMRNKHSIKRHILFFSGHANYDHIAFNYMQYGGQYKTGVYYSNNFDSSTSGYKYVGINGNMDFVKLAVFAGCNTALGDDNIAKRARDQGARISIGWNDTVYAGSHTNWLKRFNSRLAMGTTIGSALVYADSFMYLPGSGVNDYSIYSRDTLGITDSLVLNLENPDLPQNSYGQNPNDILSKYGGTTTIANQDYAMEVANIISSIVDEFNIDEYNISVYENGDGKVTLEYRWVLEGFETNCGYIGIIISDKLVALYDNTKVLSKEGRANVAMVSEQFGACEDNSSEKNVRIRNDILAPTRDKKGALLVALQLALEQTQSSPDKEALSQTYHYYYDIDNETASILVYTTYYFDGTNSLGVDFYQYPISTMEDLYDEIQ